MTDEERYRAALQDVVALLEPLGSPHTQEHLGDCEGCLYEYNEALTTAMDALAGLEPDVSRPDEERHAAWRAYGFMELHGVWSRGNAF